MTQKNQTAVAEIIGNDLRDEDGIWRTGTSGFWSMLPKTDMAAYLDDLESMPPEDIAEKHFPKLKDLIFSAASRWLGSIGYQTRRRGD